MAPRDPAGMIRKRADGGVWQKKNTPEGDWKQLSAGHGPSGQGGMEPQVAGEQAEQGEPGDAQWADTIVRHELDGHAPEATIHPVNVDVDLEGDTDAKPVMSWTDSAGAPRHAYSRAFHHRRAALLQPQLASARPVLVAAHAALQAELGGDRAAAAALGLAHLVTGHDLEDLATADVYHNRGGEQDLEVARSAGRVQRSHTADATHPDKLHYAIRHRRGHVILAPHHDAALAEHHAAGGGHGTAEEARALLAEHGVAEEHAHVMRAHALLHHAADQLSKLPAVDLSNNAGAGIQQVVSNVQAVSDYLAEQYGHPPAPVGSSYVAPALVAAYVEESGGARLWPKTFAGLHGPPQGKAGLSPVARSVALAPLTVERETMKKTPTTELEAKTLARFTDADEAMWASAVTRGAGDWGKTVKVFRSMKYSRKKKDTAWSSTSEGIASATAPSPTNSSLPESPSPSTPPTEEPRSTTPTPSPKPSSSPLADGVVAQLRRPGDGRSVDVSRDDLPRALAAANFALLAPDSRWKVGEQEITIGQVRGDRCELTYGGHRVLAKVEDVRLRLARSYGVAVDANIDAVIAPVAPRPERTSPLKLRARSLYMQVMRAKRAGRVDDRELIAATDHVMRSRYEQAIPALEQILLKAKVQRSAGEPPGAPDTSGKAQSAASEDGKGTSRKKKAVGEESTWSDGSRHVKVGPGKWKEVGKGGVRKPESGKVGQGKSTSLEGAQARLKKLREQRRRTLSPEVKKQIDAQIKSVKDRIKKLTAGHTKQYHGSAPQNAGSRTARSAVFGHEDLVQRELLELAKRSADTPLSETYRQLEGVLHRVSRSAVGSFENYAATKPGAEGLAYLASSACPGSLYNSALAYAQLHGYGGLVSALLNGVG